jgi:hypothetical protein
LIEGVTVHVLVEVTDLVLVEAEGFAAMATVHKCTMRCVPIVAMIARSHFALLAIALFTVRTVLVEKVATIVHLARTARHSKEMLPLLLTDQTRQFANSLRR